MALHGLSRTGDLVAAAAARHEGIAAFNAVTLEHAEAIVAGVSAAGVPALIAVSENTIAYHGGRAGPLLAACAALAGGASVPIGLHLDHLTDAGLVFAAAELGASSVMVDASALGWEDNVRQTSQLCARAHADGLWVEAELGAIGGKGHPHDPGVRTDPGEAARYVAATGVDALAVAVGSSHAMTERTAALDRDLVRRLAAAVDVPLVLHGSSGVGDDELAAAVGAGIVKVNIGTLLNRAFTGAVRRVLESDPDRVDPRPFLSAGREAMTTTVSRLAAVLGGARRGVTEGSTAC